MIAAPKYQRNHNYIDRRINEWLNIHYGDTSFNGRVAIGVLNKGDMKTVAFRSLSELPGYINAMHISKKRDYYLSGNSVCGVSRVKDDLFGLQNIVVDVDCHDDTYSIHEIDELVQRFIWRAERDCWSCGETPYPNSIVRTGQGIQLWWALIPCHAACLWYYDQVKSGFMECLWALVVEYSELEGLKVDSPSSSNAVGYFRMPYTKHTKRKRYTNVKILHAERFDLRNLINCVGVQNHPKADTSTETRVAMEINDLKLLQNYYAAGARRIAKLIKLRNYRNNAAGSETRNNFCFAVYNELRKSFSHEEAMARLRQFNAGFKKPMTEKELQRAVCTAQKKDGYQYSNEKLIALLEITEEEQAVIGLFAMPQHKAFAKPNATRDEVRRARREGRDAKIIQLHEAGVSQSEIARQLEINRKTVARVLKNYLTMDVPPTEEISVEAEENLSQNGSINDCLLGEAWITWDEEEEYVSVQGGQYNPAVNNTVPERLTAPSRKERNRGILVLPRPGPS